MFKKKFTYNLPDSFLSEEATQEKTAEWTYVGPEKIWVFVNEQTDKFDGIPYIVEKDDPLGTYPIPVGYYMVEIDANEEPLLATLFVNTPSEDNVLGTVKETLPDGSEVEFLDPTPPSLCYNLFEITFDKQTESFVQPFPFRTSEVTWEMVRERRNALLVAADSFPSLGMPDALSQSWLDYKQTLRDLPDVWANVEPWKVKFPKSPKD